MNLGTLAARNQVALERMLAAAEVLADRFGLAEQLASLRDARNKNQDVAALFQREAIAELMEAMAKGTDPGQPLPDDTERLNVLTVPEIAERIASADLEALEVIEEAELAGKSRKGVLSAIEARRAELDAEAQGDESEEEGEGDEDAEPDEEGVRE